jgi:hypothetical protein
LYRFAADLENWLTSAMTGAPAGMLAVKLTAVSAFSSSLRRYTSLNHLAQAARAVLHNSTQIAQMLTDLNRVDFHSVREQASWVCQCDNEIVARFENDFKLTLQQQNSLEQWGLLVEERREERPQALRRQTQFLEGSAPVPPQMELLQVRWLKTRRRVELFWGRFQFDGDQGFDFAFGCQFRLVSLDQAALRRVHVLSDRTPGRRSHGGRSYRRHPGRNREYCRL